MIKRTLHGLALGLTGVFSRLLPDRVPVTFVGPDAARELCGAVAQSGARKVLIVSDAVLAELGIVGRIAASLEAAGVAAVTYDGVEPDPTFHQVEAGLALLQREACDAVLALGGGSPMDAAKVIAAAATNGGNARKLEGLFKVRKPPVPIYAIPTTAGTGSEVTLAAVVSEPDTHTKRFFIDPKLLPDMAALDPTLMTGLPPKVTAATGMDALTHAIESFISKSATPRTRAWSVAAVKLIFNHLPVAHADGADLDARKAMALASYYAGLAFTRTSVGYVHAIAHTFGALYRTPHGWANSIALPHVLEFSLPKCVSQLAQLGEAIGVQAASPEAKARAFIAAVRELKARIEIPETLEALRAEDVPRIAEQALAEAHLNYPVPRYMERAECEALLRGMMD
ncbi:MAG: iron-containing alcohol dehydrogenase [Proteobacteria bacterium]|nr:iron-containing alcohol dehydrogenase [Pseudomonadota bacterium]